MSDELLAISGTDNQSLSGGGDSALMSLSWKKLFFRRKHMAAA